MSTEGKVPRATPEILLSVWSVLMLIVGVYFDIFWVGGLQIIVKGLDIFGVEKQCVYQIIVTLSCSLKNLLEMFLFVCFSEEFYNIPTDLMFDSENIYKF